MAHTNRGLVLSTVFTLSGVVACGALEPTGPEIIPAPETPPKEETPAPTGAAPPAVSGGTLLVTHDDAKVVAADPDRDTVWIVDTATNKLQTRVRLSAGAEPGRIVEDQDGKLHVALRRGGQIVKIDPADGSIVSQRSACAAPRGMAYDKASDNLHVVCASGELVTMKARGGDTARSLFLERDLRDVTIQGDHLLISHFRSAELIEIDGAGTIVSRVAPRTVAVASPMGMMTSASPTTAWRLVALPDNSALMLHQRGQLGPVQTTKPGGYGQGPCPGVGIVSTGLTHFTGAATAGPGAVIAGMSLVVDVAVSRDGLKLALIGPSTGAFNGQPPILTQSFGVITIFDRSQLTDATSCAFSRDFMGPINTEAEPVAADFDGSGRLWVQSRNPAQIHRLSRGTTSGVIQLDGAEDRAHEGHKIFHTVTAASVACASCHAEAGDDGHVWTFDPIGPRRTQSLRGGILASAPFHWDGDMSDLKKLMGDVFTGRMSGPTLNAGQVSALGSWLDAQPALPRSKPQDDQAVQRGKALFADAALGCKSCHDGVLFTNNASVDVGTGKAFQVPALRDLGSRAPYMHTGCAKTLQARFDPTCGGGDRHGKTSHLSTTEIADLVAYLETL